MGVSVIVPVYNGAKFIENNLIKLHKFLSDNYNEFEIIVVDDGSRDGTCNVVSSLNLSNVKVISYKDNKGRGFAIRKGFFDSRYNTVIYTDCDLPYSFDTLKNLIGKLDSGECALGVCSRVLPESRVELNYIQTPKFFMRWIGGRIVNLWIRLFLGIPYKDTQAGTKGFNKEILSDLMKRCFINRWAFDCEIIYLCYKNGIKIQEIPTIQKFSVEESTVKLSDVIEYFKDVLRIFTNHKIGSTF